MWSVGGSNEKTQHHQFFTTNTWGTRPLKKYEIRRRNRSQKASVSKRGKWVSVRQRESRACDVTILARSGPLFLTDLAFSTPRDKLMPSRSNNMSPLPLPEVEMCDMNRRITQVCVCSYAFRRFSSTIYIVGG